MLDFSQLNQFTGSETFFRHGLVPSVAYTEGVKYVADNGGAYWLLNIIASNQIESKFINQPFQTWSLTVNGGVGRIEVDDGDGNLLMLTDIIRTDFPEPGITLWCCDNMILLPSEY